jgi:hypothetical protein
MKVPGENLRSVVLSKTLLSHVAETKSQSDHCKLPEMKSSLGQTVWEMTACTDLSDHCPISTPNDLNFQDLWDVFGTTVLKVIHFLHRKYAGKRYTTLGFVHGKVPPGNLQYKGPFLLKIIFRGKKNL